MGLGVSQLAHYLIALIASLPHWQANTKKSRSDTSVLGGIKLFRVSLVNLCTAA